MQVIINGKIYDTSWAKSAKVAKGGICTLYITQGTGEWFMFEDDSYGGISTCTEQEAYNFLCAHNQVKAVKKYFPSKIKEA